MKRPEGFDRPGRDRQPAPVVPNIPPQTGRHPSPSADDRPDPLADPQSALPTEPIPPVTVADPAAADPSVADLVRALRNTRSTPPNPSESTDATAAHPEPTIDVRAAVRERRRIERTEIRRFTARFRRRRRRILAGAILTITVIAVVVGATYSPLMALRTITVEGAVAVPKDQVMAALQPLVGTPLPLVSVDRVQAALRPFPLIETFSAEALPPATMVIRIRERTPIGLVQVGSELQLVDSVGVKVGTAQQATPGQPLITAAGEFTGTAFRSAAEVVRSVPPDVRSQLVAVSAPTAQAIQLTLASGAIVLWGDASQSSFKAGVLSALLKAAPLGSVRKYDVSAPTNPTTS